MHTKEIAILATSLFVSGTMPGIASAAEEMAPDITDTRPLYRPLSLSLEAGTTGLGGAFSWRFADHFGARVGFNGFQYSDSGFAIEDLSYDAEIRIMSEPFTFDIYPWKEHSFRISVGLQFNQNQLTGTADTTGSTLPPELGMLDLEINQQPVNPYLSIGGNFFYFDKAHHWALGGELGIAYTGNPDVSLSRSGPPSEVLDAVLHYEKQQIKDYADKFRWWPVVKINVS